jgi:hypothetical protein
VINKTKKIQACFVPVEFTLKSKFQFLVLTFFVLLQTVIIAQQNYPLNREWGLTFDKSNAVIPQKISKDSSSNNTLLNYTCFKPFIVSPEHQVIDKSKSWGYRKYRKESLFIVNDTADKFYLTFDPLFNFEGGMDVADSSGEKLYKNTRGFLVRGNIGTKFAFESTFYETQATYAQYIDDYIASTGSVNLGYAIVPGQGRPKDFRDNGYDYSMASGYVSYTPCSIINIQLGHGKHFIGDGYRSLLLSDNSYNYPYARVTTSFRNLQYTNLYTSFMNMKDGGRTPVNIERMFQKKVGSFQMLTANLFCRLSLGIFQGMIFESADTTNRQHVNFNAFDPIIGVNTAVYGLHNKNNIVLGSTFKLKITNTISVFGQYMLDDIATKSNKTSLGNKSGYQIGVKYFDAFKVKNLHLQAEFSSVRPYAYSANIPSQSYTHFGQALAHPLGANFKEVVGFINYRVKRFFVELKLNYAVKGSDSSKYNYGGNVLKPDNVFPATQNTGSITLIQGVNNTIMYQDFHMGLLVNPSTNFNVIFGITNRILKTDNTKNNTQYVYIGIRTSLSNFYYDF